MKPMQCSDFVVAIGWIILGAPIAWSQAEDRPTLAQSLLRSSRGGAYVAVSTAEMRDVEALFVRTLQPGQDPAELAREWAKYGWDLQVLGPADSRALADLRIARSSSRPRLL